MPPFAGTSEMEPTGIEPVTSCLQTASARCPPASIGDTEPIAQTSLLPLSRRICADSGLSGHKSRPRAQRPGPWRVSARACPRAGRRLSRSGADSASRAEEGWGHGTYEDFRALPGGGSCGERGDLRLGVGGAPGIHGSVQQTVRIHDQPHRAGNGQRHESQMQRRDLLRRNHGTAERCHDMDLHGLRHGQSALQLAGGRFGGHRDHCTKHDDRLHRKSQKKGRGRSR